MSDTDGRSRRRWPEARHASNRLTILYVTENPAETTAAPAHLEDDHEMDVRVTADPEVAVSLLEDDDTIDCVIREPHERRPSDRTLLDYVQRCNVSLIVCGTPEGAPDTCRDYLRAGANDYVPKAAEGDHCDLLADRIKRCTALRRTRAENRRLRTAIERMGHGVLFVDADGYIEHANRAFAEFGYTSAMLEGKPLAALRPSDRDDGTYRELWKTTTDGEPWSGELVIRDAEGELRSIHLTAVPVLNEHGATQRLVAVGNDITERKERERDLRTFRAAVEQAGHVIMITDTDGTIEYVNPAFEEVTGYSRAKAIGEQPSLLASGDHDDDFYQDLWETILSGEVWEGEIINERKDGTRYYIEQTIAPITNKEGEIERFIAINTEITDRKEYERQLKRERDRLDDFASTVAHDLRNPLSIARGHAELARKNTQRTDELDTVLRALDRMNTMIDELLTLSKQGQTVVEPEPVRVRDIIKQAWRQIDTSTGTLTLADDLEGWSLSADENRFCELLENLFRNAVDHAGPNVEVRVGVLSDRTGIYVEDDGPGIPPKDRNRVFESGFTTADDGTGFGLAIVKQIVEAHGWEITLTEGKTGGTRIEIITAVSPET